MRNPIQKALIYVILLTFNLASLHVPETYANELALPKPGVRVGISPAYNPPILKGVTVDPKNPFKFDFILDKGDRQPGDMQGVNRSPNELELRKESAKLVRYFLSALTTPEEDLWVNLSPYEKNRIISESFGQTEMGRDLLAQDYLLKQITATLMYPEDGVGKQFWKRIYDEAAKRYGTTNIPVNTFNKVWIVPNKAKIYEHNHGSTSSPLATAFIVNSNLKVMLEEDYLAEEKNIITYSNRQPGDIDSLGAINAPSESMSPSRSQAKELLIVKGKVVATEGNSSSRYQDSQSDLTKQIIKEIIIPELEKEVNTGKNFAPLRQVYQSLILALWFKQRLKNSLLGRKYVDQNKINGIRRQHRQPVDIVSLGAINAPIESVSPSRLPSNRAMTMKATQGSERDDVELIYQRYLTAYKKGVFNFIKEEQDPITQQPIPRKYFSGGFGDVAQLSIDYVMSVAKAEITVYQPLNVAIKLKNVDLAMNTNSHKEFLSKVIAKLADALNGSKEPLFDIYLHINSTLSPKSQKLLNQYLIRVNSGVNQPLHDFTYVAETTNEEWINKNPIVVLMALGIYLIENIAEGVFKDPEVVAQLNNMLDAYNSKLGNYLTLKGVLLSRLDIPALMNMALFIFPIEEDLVDHLTYLNKQLILLPEGKIKEQTIGLGFLMMAIHFTRLLQLGLGDEEGIDYQFILDHWAYIKEQWRQGNVVYRKALAKLVVAGDISKNPTESHQMLRRKLHAHLKELDLDQLITDVRELRQRSPADIGLVFVHQKFEYSHYYIMHHPTLTFTDLMFNFDQLETQKVVKSIGQRSSFLSINDADIEHAIVFLEQLKEAVGMVLKTDSAESSSDQAMRANILTDYIDPRARVNHLERKRVFADLLDLIDKVTHEEGGALNQDGLIARIVTPSYTKDLDRLDLAKKRFYASLGVNHRQQELLEKYLTPFVFPEDFKSQLEKGIKSLSEDAAGIYRRVMFRELMDNLDRGVNLDEKSLILVTKNPDLLTVLIVVKETIYLHLINSGRTDDQAKQAVLDFLHKFRQASDGLFDTTSELSIYAWFYNDLFIRFCVTQLNSLKSTLNETVLWPEGWVDLFVQEKLKSDEMLRKKLREYYRTNPLLIELVRSISASADNLTDEEYLTQRPERIIAILIKAIIRGTGEVNGFQKKLYGLRMTTGKYNLTIGDLQFLLDHKLIPPEFQAIVGQYANPVVPIPMSAVFAIYPNAFVVSEALKPKEGKGRSFEEERTRIFLEHASSYRYRPDPADRAMISVEGVSTISQMLPLVINKFGTPTVALQALRSALKAHDEAAKKGGGFREAFGWFTMLLDTIDPNMAQDDHDRAYQLLNSLDPLLRVSIEREQVEGEVRNLADLPKDSAMGGIDLTARRMSLAIDRDNAQIAMPMDIDALENMEINGLAIEALEIKPLVNLPQLLGLRE